VRPQLAEKYDFVRGYDLSVCRAPGQLAYRWALIENRHGVTCHEGVSLTLAGAETAAAEVMAPLPTRHCQWAVAR
jgi:hypothetical protein